MFQVIALSFLVKVFLNILDKFVSFTGTVVRISNVRAFCKHLAFECRQCGVIFVCL